MTRLVAVIRRATIIRGMDPVLGVCLLAAFALRVWGISYGLPYVYNPDEVAIMSRALALAHNGLNPRNFVYPSFFFYVLAAAVGVLYVGARILTGVSLQEFETRFWEDPSAVYLAGRLVSVAAGTATVYVVYRIGLLAGNRTLARVAAALMTVAYFPVRDAHMVKHDVPVTLVVALLALVCWRVWRLGNVRDYVLAGLLAGVAFAMHYYAFVAPVPVVAAHVLRSFDGARLIRDRRPWLAALACLLAFACLSPYVLLDWNVALRDIIANRQIIVDRGLATYGPFGPARVHLWLLFSQGLGAVFFVAAAGGMLWMLVATPRTAIWLFAFPAAFFLFIANVWPFGRTENALFPFLAVAAAFAIERTSARTRASSAIAVVLTAACSAQPLFYAVVLDHLMTRSDTRTEARRWMEGHVPDGSGVAVQPYSVPLLPTRERLREALDRTVGGPDHAGYKFRTLLARDPFPSPAYRLYFLGTGGLDEDKIYVDPANAARPGSLESLARDGLQFVVLKRQDQQSEPLRDRLQRLGRLVFVASPLREGVSSAEPQLPDHDVRPTLDVARPGPVIEIWDIRAGDPRNDPR